MTVIELRILFTIGLMVTAVLAYVAAMGMFALVRWVSYQGELLFSRRRPMKEAAARPRSRPGTIPVWPDAESRVRLRQAAWRLRC